MKMAVAAVSSLNDIQPGSPSYESFLYQTVVVDGVCQAMKKDTTRSTSQFLLCYRHFIAANHLAYGQMFGADPENVQKSKESLSYKIY